MVHFSRRSVRVDGEEHTGELNIVPYLDILMNLIIFVLLSLTGLAAFGAINATEWRPVSDWIGDEQPQALRVFVHVERGTLVVASNQMPQPHRVAPRPDGSPDFRALTAQLAHIKAANPAQTKVVVSAAPDTAFETLVGALDAARQTEDHQLLFPDVSLAP